MTCEDAVEVGVKEIQGGLTFVGATGWKDDAIGLGWFGSTPFVLYEGRA